MVIVSRFLNNEMTEIQRENIEINELNCWPKISESFRVGEKKSQSFSTYASK
jgi:hypothetical protein